MQTCEEKGGYSKQLASMLEIPSTHKTTTTLTTTSPSTIFSPVPVDPLPVPVDTSPGPVETSPPITASVGEQLVSNFLIYELPSDDIHLSTTSHPGQSLGKTKVLDNKALVAHTESLEAGNMSLKNQLERTKLQPFVIQNIQANDTLV